MNGRTLMHIDGGDTLLSGEVLCPQGVSVRLLQTQPNIVVRRDQMTVVLLSDKFNLHRDPL